MVRILYVIENIFFGGGERAFAQIINGLEKNEHQVYVACLAKGEFIERIKGSAQIMPFSLRGWRLTAKISELARIIKDNDIQIVHSQGGRADFFARLAAKRAGVKAIVSTVAMPVQGYDVGTLKKVIYVALDRFSEGFVDKFIVVSEALQSRLIQKHKIPAGKVVKIYNGVEIDQDARCQMQDARKKIREEFGIAEDCVLIGAIGRLVWQKGLSYLIQAVKILDARSQIPDARYVIVGEGRLRKHLEGLVSSLGLSDKFIFTGFRSDIKEILAALDIFVLPSVREGQPIILLEATAASLPIVATNIEGINETIADGQTGILVDSKNPDALAWAIGDLVGDSQKAQKISLRAAKMVKKKFDIRIAIKQHEQLYEALL